MRISKKRVARQVPIQPNKTITKRNSSKKRNQEIPVQITQASLSIPEKKKKSRKITFSGAVRIGPANTANTKNDVIPILVQGSGWSVSEPPISAASHRLSRLIFLASSFFLHSFVYEARRIRRQVQGSKMFSLLNKLAMAIASSIPW